MNVTLLVLDEPSESGRIYTTEAIQKAISKLNGGLLGTIGNTTSARVNPESVGFAVSDIRIEGNQLIGKITPLQTPAGQIVQKIITDGIVAFSPVGTGVINEDGTVTDYNFISVSAILADQAT